MTDKQKKQLERNLSTSARKAKKYWVRGLVGSYAEEQAYLNPEILPVGDTTIIGLLEELRDLESQLNEFKEINAIKMNNHLKDIHQLKQENSELKSKIQDLDERLKNIERLSLD